MRHKINYAGPSITAHEVAAVNYAVQHGFYQNYRVDTQKLEEKICEVLGVKYALTTNCCTSAIHLGLALLDLKPGDEVITTDSTCIASALPIVYTGATAVFVDVDPDTWCLSPAAIAKAVTPRTRAIVVVHWNGHPAAMDEIMAIAGKHNLQVIEDGAPSLGAEYKGRKVGTIGMCGCFSFQGAKVAIGGQGGVFVTNDEGVYKKAVILASLGRTDSVRQYWSDYVGFNYGMPNLPAALARAQVERLDELVAMKRTIWSWYEEGLAGFDRVKLIREAAGTKSTYCYPPMLIRASVKRTREEILDELRKDNIDARPTQPRVSKMPMFQCRFPNPESQQVEDRGVLLPGAFNVTREDIAFVCQRLREVVR